MKKINVVLVGFLVCLAYYFYFSEYIEKANKRYEEEQGKLLVKITPDDITGISGMLEGNRFEMLKQGETWKMALPVADDVNAEAVKEILQVVAAMKFDSSFVPDDGDYSIFELKSPNYVWKFKDSAGKEQEIKIGDINIMGSKGYTQIGNDPKVYLVSISDRNSLVKRANNFRKRQVYDGDVKELSKIEIIRGDETITLVRKDKKWGIGEEGFPVNGELMKKIEEGLAALEIKSFVDEDLENRETYLSNSQLIVFHAGDKSLRLVVENAPGKSERYAIIDEQDRILSIEGSYIENFEHAADDFRQRKLFTLPVYQVTSLVIKRDEKELSVEERENHWFINKGTKESSSSKVYDLIKSYVALEIADFGATVPADDVHKLAAITLSGREGKPEKAVIYQSLLEGSKYYVAAPGGKGFYPLRDGASKDFSVTAADLEDRKVFSFDAGEINSILVRHEGKKELSFQRKGNVWRGTEGENKAIMDLLWTLQDITWQQENPELPSGLTPKSSLELTGTGKPLKIQLYTEGFCVVKGKKYEITSEDIGKIADLLNRL